MISLRAFAFACAAAALSALFPVAASAQINVRTYCVTVDGVTNNYACIKNAITAANGTGAVVRFPPGMYVIDVTGQSTINVNQSAIDCGDQYGFLQPSPTALYGTWFLIKGTTSSPFTLGASTSVKNCKWLYPQQTNPAALISYPATLALIGGSTVIEISGNVVTNAYTFVHLTDTTGGNGLLQMHRNVMTCFFACLAIEATALENYFTNNECHWGAGYNFYQSGSTMPGFSWPSGLGDALQITLYGTSMCVRLTGAGNIDAFKASNNFIGGVFAFVHGSSSSDRFLSGTFIGNDCDHVHYCIAFGGRFRPIGVSITGGSMSGACSVVSPPVCPALDTGARGIFFGMSGTSAYTTATISGVSFGSSLGGNIVIGGDADQKGVISISGGTVVGPSGAVTGMLRYNARGIDLSMVGVTFDCQNTGNGYGVQIENAGNVIMTSNQINNCNTGVKLNGTITRQFMGFNIANSTITQLSNLAAIGALVDKCNSWSAC